MAQSTFSLSWEAHRNNICSGLSILQQNEEFVDMTLAADGHFVKVHQMIMALASPYFKDLISSAGDRHPVLYLNKVSFKTLGAILEYIYTGEVMISIENLSDLIQTAKELRIKGLEDMKLQNAMNCTMEQPEVVETEIQGEETEEVRTENSEMDDEICYFEVTDREDSQSYSLQLDNEILEDSKSTRSINLSEMEESYEEVPLQESKLIKTYSCHPSQAPTAIQYTVSNRGSIQMILNRYMYYLKHSNRNNSRQWRCVDYLNTIKCPAVVMTKDNVVRQRIAAHIHVYHDQRILKKVQTGAVYEAIKDAEMEGQEIKNKVRHRHKIEKESGSAELE